MAQVGHAGNLTIFLNHVEALNRRIEKLDKRHHLPQRLYKREAEILQGILSIGEKTTSSSNQGTMKYTSSF